MPPLRYKILYSSWLHILFKVFVGGFAAIALRKSVLVGLQPSWTTKGLVVMCELPAILCLLWSVIRGPLFFDVLSPTLVNAAGDVLVILGLASKLLVARFWRAYSEFQVLQNYDGNK